MRTENAREFWTWFAGCVNRAGFDYTDSAFVDELDQRVSRLLPGCSWEMGPDADNPHEVFLALSPCGSRARRGQIEEIINGAPRISGWRLYSSKPAKAWDRRFILDRGTDTEVLLDAKDVEVSIQRDRHGIVVYVLFSASGLTDSQRQQGAEILVESELGERAVMDLCVIVRAVVDRADRPDWQAFETLRPALVGT